MGGKYKRPLPPSRGFDVARGSTSNPFEDRWARRASNASSRANVSSRAAALVTKVRAAGRANLFADRRIGEEDSEIPEEDRYLARFQRERSKRALKRARFNLDSNSGVDCQFEQGPLCGQYQKGSGEHLGNEGSLKNLPDEDVLTHGGNPLSVSILRDDYEEDVQFSDEGEDDDVVERVNRRESSLGQKSSSVQATVARIDGHVAEEVADEYDDSANHSKTYQEIMSEVIAKSKIYKAERKQEKAQVDHDTTELDSQLPDIMKLLVASNCREKQHGLRGNVESNSFDRDGKSVLSENVVSMNSSARHSNGLGKIDGIAFDYERTYLELSSERRAHATERTKTEEEKDAEERDRLESLERLRLLRMQSMDLDTLAAEASVQTVVDNDTVPKSIRGRHVSGDDLDDGFDSEHIQKSDEGDSDTTDNTEEGGEDVWALESDQNDSGSSSGHSGVDICGDALENISEMPAVDVKHASAAELKSESMLKGELECDSNKMEWIPPPRELVVPNDDIPFLFKACPETFISLQSLFRNFTCEQRGVVLLRLRKCFAVSLNPTVNKQKLAVLLSSLLAYVNAAVAATSASAFAVRQDDILSLACAEIDALLPHIYELAKCETDLVVNWAQRHLDESFKMLSNASDSYPCPGLATTWGPGKLLCFRLLARLFPGSDLRHPIITSLAVLLSHSLYNVPIVTLSDASMSCFVAEVLLEILTPAHRFSGELVCYICAMLHSSMGISSSFAKHVRCVLSIDVCHENANGPLTLRDCLPFDDRSEDAAMQLRLRTAKAVRKLAEKMLYAGDLPSVRAATFPIVSALKRTKNHEDELLKYITDISAKEELTRKPLTLYSEKRTVKVVRMLNPKFKSENGIFQRKKYSLAGALTSDMEIQRRLRRKIKKETRSTARELRRDAEIIASERLREADDSDARLRARTAKAQAFLDEQRNVARQQTKAVATSKEALSLAGRKRKKW